MMTLATDKVMTTGSDQKPPGGFGGGGTMVLVVGVLVGVSVSVVVVVSTVVVAVVTFIGGRFGTDGTWLGGGGSWKVDEQLLKQLPLSGASPVGRHDVTITRSMLVHWHHWQCCPEKIVAFEPGSSGE